MTKVRGSGLLAAQMPDDLIAAAAAWCARMEKGELSSAEDLELREWLADDPRRLAAFESVSCMMTDPALTVALRAVDDQTELEMVMPPSAAVIGRRGATWLSAAFGAALVMAGALWLAGPWTNGAVTPELIISTAPGETRTFSLSDGSSVQLSGDTALTVQMTSEQRKVHMGQGEAFFTVTPDSTRPFVVTAAGGHVQVLGTAFDLSETRDGLELAVHHGRVAFSSGQQFAPTIEVAAGERADMRDGIASAVRPFDPSNGDWRSGWLQTDGVTLAALAQRLNRGFGVSVSVDPALADKRIAGRFRLDDAEKLLRLLSTVHGFDVTHSGDNLAIVARVDSNILEN